jgi:hydroxymethylpyrimidine pyrophosphatase-like HAD family hydrolase
VTTPPQASTPEDRIPTFAADSPMLIALDIDGTLVASGRDIPDVTAQAVADAIDFGHHIVMATGRSLVGVTPIVRRLGLREGWVVASNGAVTARITRRHSLILEDVQTFDPTAAVRRAWAAIPDAFVAVEVVGYGWRVSQRFAPGLLNGRQRVVHEQYLWGQPTTRAVVQAEGVTDLLADIRSTGVTATPAGTDWIDITAVGLSKASGLEQVRASLGIVPEATVAVGDGMNDIELLTWAARGVAMGHAPEELRSVAGEVTGTIEEHGVVDVLRSITAGASR